MAVRFVNNFRAPLASSVSSAATTLSFTAGYGDLFRAALGSALGSDHVYGTLFNSGGDIEIVKITATVDNDFTVVRGVDGTTSKAWLAGDYMACRPCAASLSEAVSLPTGLARSGVNLDITELRGLTTPLRVAQGGTGVKTYAALLSALGISLPLPVASGGTGVTSLSALATLLYNAMLDAAVDIPVYGMELTKNPYTNGVTTSGAHGLSGVPTALNWYLQCLSPELGYNPGDRVYCVTDHDDEDHGFTLAANATDVSIVANISAPLVVNKTTNSGASPITPSKWKLVVRPVLVR